MITECLDCGGPGGFERYCECTGIGCFRCRGEGIMFAPCRTCDGEGEVEADETVIEAMKCVSNVQR
jgi:DnaJ-class molecular chaperone